MNKLVDRLENRTRKVIHALEHLSKLSSERNGIPDEWIDSIESALSNALHETVDSLRTGRDEINFTLKGDE